MSDDINQLVQAASTSLFSPESLDDIRCRLSFIEASECNCGEGPHENAIHDLIKDDVPVLFHVIHCLAAELEAARAEVERLRARCEPQVYVTTPPCSEYGEGTRGEVRHPIGRCGDPNCGGDW